MPIAARSSPWRYSDRPAGWRDLLLPQRRGRRPKRHRHPGGWGTLGPGDWQALQSAFAEAGQADDLAFIMTGPSESESRFSLDLDLGDATREFQVQFIEKQIHATRGNMTDAAKKLGLHRSNLYRKMRQLGMDCTEDE